MSESSHATSILGPGAVFKGELSFEGDARIQGTFEGTITSAGEVRIEPGGHVSGDINANAVTIDGKVEGNLTAVNRLELLGRAEVRGDIACGTLVVVQGATFAGQVRVGPDAVTQARGDRPGAMPRSIVRPSRPRLDTDWLAEPITTPANRLPDWSAPRPAWTAPAEAPKP